MNKRTEQQRRARTTEFLGRGSSDKERAAHRLLGALGLEENELERYLTRQAEQRMAWKHSGA